MLNAADDDSSSLLIQRSFRRFPTSHSPISASHQKLYIEMELCAIGIVQYPIIIETNISHKINVKANTNSGTNESNQCLCRANNSREKGKPALSK